MGGSPLFFLPHIPKKTMKKYSDHWPFIDKLIFAGCTRYGRRKPWAGSIRRSRPRTWRKRRKSGDKRLRKRAPGPWPKRCTMPIKISSPPAPRWGWRCSPFSGAPKRPRRGCWRLRKNDRRCSNRRMGKGTKARVHTIAILRFVHYMKEMWVNCERWSNSSRMISFKSLPRVRSSTRLAKPA